MLGEDSTDDTTENSFEMSSNNSSKIREYPSTNKLKKLRPMNQPTVLEAFEKQRKFKQTDKKQADITQKITKFMVKGFHSFTIVEEPYFKNLIEHLEPRYNMVTRKTISNVIIPNLYDKTKMEVLEELKNIEYFALTTDMWTSTANDDYISLTIHSVNTNFELVQKALEVIPFGASHTGEHIAETLGNILEDWNISINQIVACVHDNAANMSVAMRKLKINHLSCCAHTLQLVVNDALHPKHKKNNASTSVDDSTVNVSGTAIANLLKICRSIVGHFKHSTKSTKVLIKAQRQFSIPEHTLIQDEPTRWNSSLHMILRLLEQRKALVYASTEVDSKSLSSSDWETLQQLADLLQIFDKATLVLSLESISISEVIPIISAIVNNLNSVCVSTTLEETKSILITSMQTRFKNMEQNELYCIATILDPRIKCSMFSSQNIIEEAKKILIEKLYNNNNCFVGHEEEVNYNFIFVY